MKRLFDSFIFLIVTILINFNLVSGIKMTVMNRRNLLMTCSSENNCDECRQDGHYKKCGNGLCYCCNMDGKCISQNMN